VRWLSELIETERSTTPTTTTGTTPTTTGTTPTTTATGRPPANVEKT
jgi:hypothetical protein